jgi:GYF domain 2
VAPRPVARSGYAAEKRILREVLVPADWYCKVMGEESGPLSSEQLRAMAASRKLLPDSLVKKGKDGEWALATRVNGLFDSANARQKSTIAPPAPQKHDPGRPNANNPEADTRRRAERWLWIRVSGALVLLCCILGLAIRYTAARNEQARVDSANASVDRLVSSAGKMIERHDFAQAKKDLNSALATVDATNTDKATALLVTIEAAQGEFEAQSIFQHAKSAIGERQIPLAIQRLTTYLVQPHALNRGEAQDLLIQATSAISDAYASKALRTMSDNELARINSDAQTISNPAIRNDVLVDIYRETVRQNIPSEIGRRDEEKKRITAASHVALKKQQEAEERQKKSQREAKREEQRVRDKVRKLALEMSAAGWQTLDIMSRRERADSLKDTENGLRLSFKLPGSVKLLDDLAKRRADGTLTAEVVKQLVNATGGKDGAIHEIEALLFDQGDTVIAMTLADQEKLVTNLDVYCAAGRTLSKEIRRAYGFHHIEVFETQLGNRLYWDDYVVREMNKKAADPRSEANAKAIQDFGFEQITFKTTLSEFKKAYRDAISKPKSNVGVSHFEIYPENVHLVMVDFLDERLLEISLDYTDEQVRGLGGAAGMRTRLLEKFGAPDRDKDGVAAWESGGKRIVASEGKDGGYVICILDNGLAAR